MTALAAHAAVVVTDDFPASSCLKMVAAAWGRQPDVAPSKRWTATACCPCAPDDVFPTVRVPAARCSGCCSSHLRHRPAATPLAKGLDASAWTLPKDIRERWPDVFTWLDRGGSLSALPIDHSVCGADIRGGSTAAHERLDAFVDDDLSAYGNARNVPDQDVSSRLSPYLHWGHIGAHEVFERLMTREGWLGDLPARATGAREGWWGVSPAAESFLDEFVTWREVGFNMTSKREDYAAYESLPSWARKTLDAHAHDPRESRYTLQEFEQAATHDLLWNAAQTQLVREGRIHNYLRMLGKEDPRVDGVAARGPGRHDRAQQRLRARRTR
ncbi:MAG: hypothetical protein R2712_10580 [Vicinamibacterales bacterium]